MSQNALPSADAGLDTLFARVYAPAVLDFMASRGYPARTEKAARDLLEVVGKVKEHAPAAREKSAGDLYGAAVEALDRFSGAPTKRASDALAEAAEAVSRSPEIYNAVLAVKAAELDARPR